MFNNEPHGNLMRRIYAILEDRGVECALDIEQTIIITEEIMEVVKEYLPDQS